MTASSTPPHLPPGWYQPEPEPPGPPPPLPLPQLPPLPPPPDPEVGAYVRLQNYITHPSFNGVEGMLTGQAEDGRWHMSLFGKARGFHLRYVKEINYEVLRFPHRKRPLPHDAPQHELDDGAAGDLSKSSEPSTKPELASTKRPRTIPAKFPMPAAVPAKEPSVLPAWFPRL
jgi:hypothetical protein